MTTGSAHSRHWRLAGTHLTSLMAILQLGLGVRYEGKVLNPIGGRSSPALPMHMAMGLCRGHVGVMWVVWFIRWCLVFLV